MLGKLLERLWVRAPEPTSEELHRAEDFFDRWVGDRATDPRRPPAPREMDQAEEGSGVP